MMTLRNWMAPAAFALAILLTGIILMGNQRPAHAQDADTIVNGVFCFLNGFPTTHVFSISGCSNGTPAPSASLTLVKVVDGGSAAATDWTLSANGPTDISGVTGSADVTSVTVETGTYTLSESGSDANYTAGDWSCSNDGSSDINDGTDQVTLNASDNDTCTITNTFTPPTPTTFTVTIDKFIDGVAASSTAATASFPMVSSWNAVNLGGAGNGTYPLSTTGFNSTNAYEAITSPMDSGSSYTTNEDTSGDIVGATCDNGDPYALVGYTTGDSLAAAEAATPSATIPDFSNLTQNENVIVWNESCVPTPPPSCTIVSDTQTEDVTDGHPAVLVSVINPNWTATSNPIAFDPAAMWIWSEDPTADTTDVVTKDFTRTFDIVGTPTDASIDIGADNGFVLIVNGTTVVDASTTENNYTASQHFDITSDLTTGSNTVEVDVTNFAVADSDSSSNPAGTVFQINLPNNDCGTSGGGGTPSSDLSVTKTVDTATPVLGGDVVYTITATNNGPDSADNVVVSDLLPTGLTYVTDDSTTTGTTYDSGTGAWDVGTLADEASVTLHITAMVNADDSTDSTITNIATASSDSNDPNSENNSGSVSVEPADATLTIIKDTFGGDGTFDFTVSSTTDDSIAPQNVDLTTVDSVATSSPISLAPGTYTVSELEQAGWHFDSSNCQYNNDSVGVEIPGGEQITVDSGDTVTCTFFNTNTNENASTGVLEVKKIVDNDGGGTASPDDFSFDMNGMSTTTFNSNGTNDITVPTGNYSVTEASANNYTPAYDNCDNVNVAADATTTCTITNTFQAPEGGGGGGGGGGGSTPDTTPPGGNGPIVGSGGGGGGPAGQVLGASTGPIIPCTQYLTSFIKLGGNNDPEQVTRLQAFLDQFEGDTLPITGIYDQATYNAVKAFQQKYAGDVLTPWGENAATGFVYLTTRREVNIIYCNFTLQFPLTAAEQAQIAAYKSGGAAQGGNGGAQTPVTNGSNSDKTSTSTGGTPNNNPFGLNEVGGAAASQGGNAFWSAIGNFFSHLLHH